MKRPSFQFYPSDWRKDTALQFCSLAARGLWVEMMCIAHECDPYGHLVVNGKAMTTAQIGRLVGISEKECGKLLAELFDAGVPSVTDRGVIFSRRMVRDEDIRNRRAAGGAAGANHGIKGASFGKKGGRPPIAKTPQQTPDAATQITPHDTKGRGVIEPPLYPPPSSSSSTTVNSVSYETDGVAVDGVVVPDPPAGKTPDDLTKTELWAAGKSLLLASGLPKAQCGSFVGKLVKDYGDAVVVEAVRSAVVTQPADPVEYLKATCQRSVGTRRSGRAPAPENFDAVDYGEARAL